MRFVDSNIFLYAILKPKRRLTRDEIERKSKAEEMHRRINRGEQVLTSVVHVSEVANVLEDAVNLDFSIDWVESLLKKASIRIQNVEANDYLSASLQARISRVSVNDALAYIIMKDLGFDEIYSFDNHFDDLDVKRIEE